MNLADISLTAPLIALFAGSILLMLAVAFKRHHGLALISTAGVLVLALALMPRSLGRVQPLFAVDGLALYYWALVLATSLALALLSGVYFEKQAGQKEEFYILLLTGTLGAAVMAASRHFISLFLGLEVLSVSLYGLLAYGRKANHIEAGLKYLILASVSGAFLVFGLALIYAETGSLSLTGMARAGQMPTLVFMTGLTFILVGAGFKLAVAPFHLWAGDVYQGAPAPATAFVATVSKAAMVAFLLRFFAHLHNSPLLLDGPFVNLLGALALASMFLGNWMALLQNSVKRLLAFSSIAHLGYVLMAFLTGPLSLMVVTVYMTAYLVTSLAGFGVIILLSTKERDADDLDDFRGLAWRRPWAAAFFILALLSLAGIPLTLGFLGKFYVLTAGVGSGLWVLVFALAMNSAIGVFYYMRVVFTLFQEKDAGAAESPAAPLGMGVLAGLGALLVVLGVYPSPLFFLVEKLVYRLIA